MTTSTFSKTLPPSVAAKKQKQPEKLAGRKQRVGDYVIPLSKPQPPARRWSHVGVRGAPSEVGVTTAGAGDGRSPCHRTGHGELRGALTDPVCCGAWDAKGEGVWRRGTASPCRARAGGTFLQESTFRAQRSHSWYQDPVPSQPTSSHASCPRWEGNWGPLSPRGGHRAAEGARATNLLPHTSRAPL